MAFVTLEGEWKNILYCSSNITFDGLIDFRNTSKFTGVLSAYKF